MFESNQSSTKIRPRWFVWENVPGAFSVEGGAAFGQLLSEMDDLGYGVAWRVLDAQFFGVAQRRRRVFLVGCLGDPERAAEILFERDSLRWDHPSSRDKREELAGAAGAGSGSDSRDGCLTPWDVQSRRIFDANTAWPALYAGDGGGHGYTTYAIAGNIINRKPENGGHHLGIEDDGACYSLTTADRHAVAYAVRMRAGKPGGGKGPLVQTDVSGTLATGNDQTIPGAKQQNYICMASGQANAEIGHTHTVCMTQYGAELAGTLTARHDSSPCADRGQNVVCMASGQANAEIGQDLCPAQAARQYKGPPIFVYTADGAKAVYHDGMYWVVRRLMPVECERLQGFPDGWTDIPFRGKPATDAPRYKALGNSMAVPVIRWLGERIRTVC